MKIAIVMYTMELGGTEKALLSLIKEISKKNEQIDLYFLKKRGLLLDRIPNNIHLYEIGFVSDFYRFIAWDEPVKDNCLKSKIYQCLRKIVKIFCGNDIGNSKYSQWLINKCCRVEEEYDLVIDFWGYGQFNTIFAANILKGRKKATWMHDEKIEYLKWVENEFDKFDYFVGVSNAIKFNFENMYHKYADRCLMIHNFTDLESIKKNSEELCFLDNELGSDIKFVSVGRLTPQKGYDLLISAGKIMRQKGINYTIYIIGEGPLHQELNSMIESEGLSKNIFLLGKKDNPLPFVRACDFYIQPSRSEGYSTTIVEARCLRKIIFASNIPSNMEQIEDEKNGFLIDLNPKMMADRVISVVKNKDLLSNVENYYLNEKMDFKEDIVMFQNLFAQ